LCSDANDDFGATKLRDAMIDETQPKPQIIEAFHDYAPPFDATKDLDFSELLFHELGHHIHRMQRPEYEGRENVADNGARNYRAATFEAVIGTSSL
jgi:hypothetical protein